MSQEETTQVAAEETNEAAAPEANPTETTSPLVAVEELAAARKEAQEFKEGWLRERADFNNYKKRMENTMKDMRENAAIEALLTLLPIIDDFERAMANVPAEMTDHPWMSGVGGIHRKFQKILEDKGVVVIDPVGELFDPTRHEAVAMADSDEVESGHVVETLQKGYARAERVLRPAIVKVAN